jgi:hypothetical protein
MADGVGYGRPPKASRWKKGQSGNPSGRPKGAPSLMGDLASELGEVVQLTEGGRGKRVSKQRAVLKSLVNKAIKGDTRAAGILISFLARMIEATPDKPALPSARDREIVEKYLERRLKARMALEQEGEQ